LNKGFLTLVLAALALAVPSAAYGAVQERSQPAIMPPWCGPAGEGCENPIEICDMTVPKGTGSPGIVEECWVPPTRPCILPYPSDAGHPDDDCWLPPLPDPCDLEGEPGSTEPGDPGPPPSPYRDSGAAHGSSGGRMPAILPVDPPVPWLPEEWDPGDWDPGDWDPGDWNPGDYPCYALPVPISGPNQSEADRRKARARRLAAKKRARTRARARAKARRLKAKRAKIKRLKAKKAGVRAAASRR
jgi:hypothetical protein